LIARVNGSDIHEQQLRDRLSAPLEVVAAAVAASTPSEQALLQKKRALDAIIDEEVVLQQAMKDGLLQRSARLRREIMQEYIEMQVRNDASEPTEDEIATAYKAQQADFDMVSARHILIKSAANTSAAEQAARKKAEKLLAQLRQKGTKADFNALAKQHSDDADTKEQGGNLGYFSRAKMVTAFSDAAFALQKEGDISPLVKTEFGYHIIMLTGDRRGLENNRTPIRLQLARTKKKQLYADLLKKLRDDATVKIDGDALVKMSAATNAKVNE
jgi:parvulin-like peptidyl-prolyl isomerase